MREYFKLEPDLIYLASAAQSICPESVRKAAAQYRKDYEANPARNLTRVWAELWKIQGQLGEFFHANPSDLFLRASVTVVMSDLILGVKLPSDGEILTTNLEYAAITNACR